VLSAKLLKIHEFRAHMCSSKKATNLSGLLILMASSGAFAVTWSPPVDLWATSSWNQQNGPAMAASADGSSLLVNWNPRAFTSVVARSLDRGSSWTMNSGPRFDGITRAALSLDGATAVLSGLSVWRPDGCGRDNGKVRVAASTDGGNSWLNDRLMSASGIEACFPAKLHKITLSPDGNKLAATWIQGVRFVNFSRSADRGSTWSAPTTVSNENGSDPQYPEISSSLDSSKYTVVWSRRGNNGSIGYAVDDEVVQATSSTDGGLSWSTPIVISKEKINVNSDAASWPKILYAANGTKIVVTWVLQRGVVQVSTSTNNGVSWSTPTNVSHPECPANEPQIVSSADGSTLAIGWLCAVTSANSEAAVYAQVTTSGDSGTSWSLPVRLSGDQRVNWSSPELAVSQDGAVIAVAWPSTTSQAWIATSTNRGYSWSSPVSISTPTEIGYTASAPKIVVWSESEGVRIAATWVEGVSNNVLKFSSSSLVDYRPAPFGFDSLSDVSRSTYVRSNPILPILFNSESAISISNGQYSVGCTDSFAGADGTISPGQSVCVRHTSAAQFDTTTTTVLTIGGVSTSFASRTTGDFDGDGIGDNTDLDIDGDGMLNEWETLYGFNPRFSNDRNEDADNDGLSNFREHGLRTHPRQIDSDGDGVRDDVEVNQGFDPLDQSCRSIECTLIRDDLSLPMLKRARQNQGR
jgi:hypothetical protein